MTPSINYFPPFLGNTRRSNRPILYVPNCDNAYYPINPRYSTYPTPSNNYSPRLVPPIPCCLSSMPANPQSSLNWMQWASIRSDSNRWWSVINRWKTDIRRAMLRSIRLICIISTRSISLVVFIVVVIIIRIIIRIIVIIVRVRVRVLMLVRVSIRGIRRNTTRHCINGSRARRNGPQWSSRQSIKDKQISGKSMNN